MENLGYTFETPSKNKNGKWNSVDIFYKDEEDYLSATSKLVKMFQSPNGDGKCIVTDNDNQKHFMEIVHVTFDSKSNSVKVFPYECNALRKNN